MYRRRSCKFNMASSVWRGVRFGRKLYSSSLCFTQTTRITFNTVKKLWKYRISSAIYTVGIVPKVGVVKCLELHTVLKPPSATVTFPLFTYVIAIVGICMYHEFRAKLREIIREVNKVSAFAIRSLTPYKIQ